MLAIAGCGADPVREDLENYQRSVLTPLARIEDETARTLKPLLADLDLGKAEAREAQRVYQGELVERYRGVVTLLETNPPKTKALLELHAQLASQYRQAVKELTDAAEALSRSDWRKLDEVHARLAKLGFESVRTDFVKLGAEHGLDVPEK